jgi:hypothetical protein
MSVIHAASYCTLRYVLYITLNLAVMCWTLCVGLWDSGILVFWYGGLSFPVGLRRYGSS